MAIQMTYFNGNFYSRYLDKYTPKKVYRLLNPEDIKNLSEGKGISAKNPEAEVPLAKFVRNGSKKIRTQFIATTETIATAVYNSIKYGQGPEKETLVEFSLSECNGIMVYDLRNRASAIATMKEYPGETKTTEGYFRLAANFSTSSRELDLVGEIPYEAVKVIDMVDWLSVPEHKEWLQKKQLSEML